MVCMCMATCSIHMLLQVEMDEKQLRREIALAITNLRGVKLVSLLCE